MSHRFFCCIFLALVFLINSGREGESFFLSAQSLEEGEASPDLQSEERSILLDDTLPGEPETLGEGVSLFVILRMILVLLLAALAVYGVVFFLKRLTRAAEYRDPHLKILASLHLGGSRFAYVLSVGPQAWLVGSSENGVSLIAKVEDQETVDAMRLNDSRKNAETGRRFLDFKTMLSRLSGKDFPEDSENPSADNLRKRRERLRRL
ncbi:MAG: flagellar biosynthetic protein FliO [Treponema sp.]|nr:flagellar biosynthetic protein FliO [Treponema sp.]